MCNSFEAPFNCTEKTEEHKSLKTHMLKAHTTECKRQIQNEIEKRDMWKRHYY